jgi:aspartyl protease family protein
MTLRCYPVQKSGNLFFVKAAVARVGAEPSILKLLVDTGASQTSLSKLLLIDLGYTHPDPTPKISILTGNGLIQAPIIRVAWFNCLGERLEDYPVLSLDLPISSYINGILGMDFLLRFNALIDIGKRQIILP